jgi:hypothetical protein
LPTDKVNPDETFGFKLSLTKKPKQEENYLIEEVKLVENNKDHVL